MYKYVRNCLMFSLLTVKRRLKRKSVYLMHLMLVSMAPGVRRH